MATGGCQAVYTMYPSQTDSNPSCANLTLPPALQVEGTVEDGPLSRYGWINQVTDLDPEPPNSPTDPHLSAQTSRSSPKTGDRPTP